MLLPPFVDVSMLRDPLPQRWQNLVKPSGRRSPVIHTPLQIDPAARQLFLKGIIADRSPAQPPTSRLSAHTANKLRMQREG
jgi:hypothetical protein